MQLLHSQQAAGLLPGGGRAPQQQQQRHAAALLLPAPSLLVSQRRQQQHCCRAAADSCSWLAAAATALQQQQQPHRCPPLCGAALPVVNSSRACSSSRGMQQQQSSWRCHASKAAAGGSQGRSGSDKQRPPSDDMAGVIMIEGDEGEEGEGDDEEEGFVDFEVDEDEFEEEEEEGGEFEDDDDEEGGFEAGSDEDPGPEVLTGNVEWGDTALRVAEAVLAQPENTNLALYLFRVVVPTKVIEVRLDKLDDAYGSPGLEDIERFSRGLAQGLEAELGPEAAGDISFEVSSPGAERTLIIPTDLERFKELPMRVEYMTEVGIIANPVLRFQGLADGVTCWELADVKANQAVKGRGLTKKQRMTRYDIPVERLERVRIYVDF